MRILEKIKELRNVHLVFLMVVIGALLSSLGILYTLGRHSGFAHDKAIYFQEEYTSTFEVTVNNDEMDDLIFKSGKDGEDWKAVIEFDDNTYDNIEVDENGYLDADEEVYLFLWWEEEDYKFVDNENGIGKAINAIEDKEITDPTNVFLNASETYTAESLESTVYLKGIYATQASYKYIIKRNSDGKTVGDAIVDMTSGIAFELNLYEEGFDSYHFLLTETDFPISRNRHVHIIVATIAYGLCFIGLYFILRKWKDAEGEELKDGLLLGGIGFIGLWIDLFLDMWYTTSGLFWPVFLARFLPIGLILVFKREKWLYCLIPVTEIFYFGVFLIWNMEFYVLWLATSNIALWLALLADAYLNEKKITPRELNT